MRDPYLDGRTFYSSADEGQPIPGSVAECLEYQVATTITTPALDEALAAMKKRGAPDRHLPKVPWLTKGLFFYAKEKPGAKLIIISPKTTQVYEVERVD